MQRTKPLVVNISILKNKLNYMDKVKLTQVQIDARNERVAKVEAEIDAEAKARALAGVKETKEEKDSREESEVKRIEAAKVVSHTKEEQLHLDARDARVLVVENAIASAKVLRDAAVKDGVMETPGTKTDREAKEAADRKEAAHLNVIEPVSIDINNAEVQKLEDKVNEIIAYLNKGSK